MLLEYGGGCQKGAKHFGLMKYVDAVAFCVQMRKHMANYCLCDLACWLCLAAPDKKKGDASANAHPEQGAVYISALVTLISVALTQGVSEMACTVLYHCYLKTTDHEKTKALRVHCT